MKFLMKIKYKIQYFFLQRKYQKNFGNKQNPLLCGEKERGLGKTTIVIKDAAKRKLPIIVDNQVMKHNILDMAIRMNLNVVCFAVSDNIRGTPFKFFLIDGTYHTYKYCIDNGMVIMNGFVLLTKDKKVEDD